MPPTSCPNRRPRLAAVAKRNRVALSCYGVLIQEARRAIPCPHDADDAAQNAALRALMAAADYDPAKGRPGTWAGWKLRSVLAARQKHREFRARMFGGGRPNPARLADHRGPARDVEREDLIAHVRAAVASLPARHRRVLRLRMEGLSVKGVADRLGLGLKAAADRVEAALTAAWFAMREAGLTPGD